MKRPPKEHEEPGLYYCDTCQELKEGPLFHYRPGCWDEARLCMECIKGLFERENRSPRRG